MGTHGTGEENYNGKIFSELCRFNDLVFRGTLFPNKTIHKTTWISPNDKTENQIDHITISRKWRRSMHDVRMKRGADVASDHHLVAAVLKTKLKTFNDSAGRPAHKAEISKAMSQERQQVQTTDHLRLLRPSTDMLLPLLCKIWEREQVPEDWKRVHLVKLPKKGDLSSCTNWRGIMLLSIPGKVLTRIMSKRLSWTRDSRDEQAGFRQDHPCRRHSYRAHHHRIVTGVADPICQRTGKSGIQWIFMRQLKDLDFADDITFFHKDKKTHKRNYIVCQKKPGRLDPIYIGKTEAIRINNRQANPLQLHQENIKLKEVDKFILAVL
ncbi:hypothetical protein EGW08_021510 [Elysia chlorotica]|uniref:Reverse transcriptase domain-containing protein n=1 Tax=Elysia chlorotica TaxID=188477 RepID=A0A433SNB9_ELYCH|nr:hypothetical protein EGW08_021510 [Elysia chlorotica]